MCDNNIITIKSNIVIFCVMNNTKKYEVPIKELIKNNIMATDISNKGIIEKVIRKTIQNKNYKFIIDNEGIITVDINYILLDEEINIVILLELSNFKNNYDYIDNIENEEKDIIIKKLLEKVYILENKINTKKKINEVDHKIVELENKIKILTEKINVSLSDLQKKYFHSNYCNYYNRIIGPQQGKNEIHNELKKDIVSFALNSKSFINQYDLDKKTLFVIQDKKMINKLYQSNMEFFDHQYNNLINQINITWDNIQKYFPHIFKLFDKYKKTNKELEYNKNIKYSLINY